MNNSYRNNYRSTPFQKALTCKSILETITAKSDSEERRWSPGMHRVPEGHFVCTQSQFSFWSDGLLFVSCKKWPLVGLCLVRPSCFGLSRIINLSVMIHNKSAFHTHFLKFEITIIQQLERIQKVVLELFWMLWIKCHVTLMLLKPLFIILVSVQRTKKMNFFGV